MISELSESQWRKVETASRLLLAVSVLVGVGFAADTGVKINKLEEKVRSGNCSYLLETGYVEYNYEGDLPERSYSNYSGSDGFSGHTPR